MPVQLSSTIMEYFRVMGFYNTEQHTPNAAVFMPRKSPVRSVPIPPLSHPGTTRLQYAQLKIQTSVNPFLTYPCAGKDGRFHISSEGVHFCSGGNGVDFCASGKSKRPADDNEFLALTSEPWPPTQVGADCLEPKVPGLMSASFEALIRAEKRSTLQPVHGKLPQFHIRAFGP